MPTRLPSTASICRPRSSACAYYSVVCVDPLPPHRLSPTLSIPRQSTTRHWARGQLGRDPKRAALGYKHTEFIAAAMMPAKGSAGKPSSLPGAPPLAPSQAEWVAIPCLDAAALWPLSEWGPVPQGPTPATRLPRAARRRAPGSSPCRSSRSAAHPTGSLLMERALACGHSAGPLFAFAASGIGSVTAGASSFGSARFLLRFSPLPGRSAKVDSSVP